MKTFAVNSTVIFVTEVIFLGIYCTFFCHETHSKSAPLNAFFKKRKKKRIQTSNDQLEKQLFWKTECHLTTFAQIPVEPYAKTHFSFLFRVFHDILKEKERKKKKKLIISYDFPCFLSPEDFWISVLRNTCVYSLDIRWCQSFNCKTV